MANNFIANYVFVTYVMFTIVIALFFGIVIMLFYMKHKNERDRKKILGKMFEIKKLVTDSIKSMSEKSKS